MMGGLKSSSQTANSQPWLLVTRLPRLVRSFAHLALQPPKVRRATDEQSSPPGLMAVGCRSTRTVLMKPGNWSRRTRWREGKTERGCLMLDPGSGNTSEASYLESLVTGTAQDSIPGMRRCCMANPSLEEPDAVMSARTGLWETWVRNHPRPPGPNGNRSG